MEDERDLTRCAGDVLLDRYEIVDRINFGPMSRVHKAWDRREKRFVAVKMAFPYPHDPAAGYVERLQREGWVLMTLRHPRILRAFDAGPVGPDGYAVMADLLEGESLDSRLDARGSIPVREAVTIAAEALDGLETVHRAGLMHRDVKPGNLMLTPAGAVLIDFGLVTAAPLRRARRLTEPGTAVGTPFYMSSEQFQDSLSLDGRTDLFSLGLVLYRMLTGKRAFPGGSVEGMIRSQLERRPAMPVALAAPRLRLPKRLEDALMRSIEIRASDRFQTAAEMRNEILAAAP